MAEVTAQEPLQTVGNLGALEAEAVPDVWVPDSSLWAARAGDAALEDAGSMASSPVVLATSRAAADALGWSGQTPHLGGGAEHRPPARRAGPRGQRRGHLGARRGPGVPRRRRSGRHRGRAGGAGGRPRRRTGPGRGAGRPRAAGSADAALVPVSEQEVFAANAGTEDPALVAVYPSEGSPALDYPVLRVGLAVRPGPRRGRRRRPGADVGAGARRRPRGRLPHRRRHRTPRRRAGHGHGRGRAARRSRSTRPRCRGCWPGCPAWPRRRASSPSSTSPPR